MKQEESNTTPLAITRQHNVTTRNAPSEGNVIERVPGVASRAAHVQQAMADRRLPGPRLHPAQGRRPAPGPRLDLAVLKEEHTVRDETSGLFDRAGGQHVGGRRGSPDSRPFWPTPSPMT